MGLLLLLLILLLLLLLLLLFLFFFFLHCSLPLASMDLGAPWPHPSSLICMTGAAALLLGLAACGVVGAACSLGLAGRLVLMVKGYCPGWSHNSWNVRTLYIYPGGDCQ